MWQLKAEYSMLGTSIGELLCLTEVLTICAHTELQLYQEIMIVLVRIFQRIVPQNYAHSLRTQRAYGGLDTRRSINTRAFQITKEQV